MLRRRLLAADTLEPTAVIEWVDHWIRWFISRRELEVEGILVSPDSVGATIERLYFDGPKQEDWSALARLNGEFVPAFDPDHIFIANASN